MTKPTTLAVLCLFLTACSALPDVERSYRECLVYGGSPSYVFTTDTRKAECKR
jgi:hypothetical protein